MGLKKGAATMRLSKSGKACNVFVKGGGIYTASKNAVLEFLDGTVAEVDFALIERD